MKKYYSRVLVTMYFFYKCGDKEAPVVTFVANVYLTLDTTGLVLPSSNALTVQADFVICNR